MTYIVFVTEEPLMVAGLWKVGDIFTRWIFTFCGADSFYVSKHVYK